MFNFFQAYLLWRLVEKITLLFLLTSSLLHTNISAMPTSIGEDEVKAVFLFNFSLFTTWPTSAFSTNTSSFHLCVLGDEDFKEKLQTAVEGEHVGKRPVRISDLQDYKSTTSCHILFVSQSQEDQLDEILTYAKSYPILTVSDIKDFVRQGGMIEFYIFQSRVRFMVDPETIKEVDLKISSRLLNIAKIASKK